MKTRGTELMKKLQVWSLMSCFWQQEALLLLLINPVCCLVISWRSGLIWGLLFWTDVEDQRRRWSKFTCGWKICEGGGGPEREKRKKRVFHIWMESVCCHINPQLHPEDPEAAESKLASVTATDPESNMTDPFCRDSIYKKYAVPLPTTRDSSSFTDH